MRESTRWFEKLVAALPGMAGFRRVPERIPVDAMVYLGPPPRFLRDFSAEEAMLLRAIASGARVDELQARLHDGWAAAQRALFSLIARQAVTLSRGQAVHPDTWKRILTEVESSLAIESLSRIGDAPATPPPVPQSAPIARERATSPTPSRAVEQRPEAATGGASASTVPPWSSVPVQDPSRMIDLPDEDAPPLELASPPRHDSRASMRAIDASGWSAESVAWAASSDAGGGRRAGKQERSADAQKAYDGARSQMAAGNVGGALELLRRALRLCPGDSEIAEELGKLASRDSGPGAR